MCLRVAALCIGGGLWCLRRRGDLQRKQEAGRSDHPGKISLQMDTRWNTPQVRYMLNALTIFLSAFLLFQVQSICAKRLLPWFGGAPAVWTTCQLFFQLTLLAGYAYAHWLTQYLRPRRQAIVHIALLGAGCAALVLVAVLYGAPLLAPGALKPSGSERPIPLLLWTLLLTVGFPFLALSATGPLVQSWHSRSAASLDRTYRLYALSNVGSLLGLISYPFGIERAFDLNQQAWGWTSLFIVFALACGFTGLKAARLSAADRVIAREPEAAVDAGMKSKERGHAWLWFLLSFTSSALFLSTTNKLCQEVAVIPFLWVLPLAIYLLTFIICFDRPNLYSRRWAVAGAMAFSLWVLLSQTTSQISVPAQVFGYSAFLGFFCMVCHGELVRLRPGSSRLTLFYLIIAVGGAGGGAFVSLLAPALFSGLWELFVTILVGWVVIGWSWMIDRTTPIWKAERIFFACAAALACLFVAPVVIVMTPLRRTPWVIQHPWTTVEMLTLALTLIVSAAFWKAAIARNTFWARALLALMVGLAGVQLVRRIGESRADTVYAARNFYGLVRIVAVKNQLGEVGAYKLFHGIINHGLQFTDPESRDAPTAYFSRSSGVGVAARAVASRAGLLCGDPLGHLNIGIMGEGVGTLATYARSGDHVRFYEIDPIVIDVADKGSPYFTYLADCHGLVSVIAGDARLSLERELSDGSLGNYDLLAMDAFSGDSVPVHLLTEEAFRLYLKHLRGPSSILAVNVTNKYIDLEPVVAANAAKFGLKAVRIDSSGKDSRLPESNSWILLSKDESVFSEPIFAEANPRPLHDRQIQFSDQYSNLFRVLK